MKGKVVLGVSFSLFFPAPSLLGFLLSTDSHLPASRILLFKAPLCVLPPHQSMKVVFIPTPPPFVDEVAPLAPWWVDLYS